LFKEKSLLLHPILKRRRKFAPLQTLQGRVKFPIGGKVRKPFGTNRCNYGTDSIVWMEED
jgi:hypothetical protein